MTANEREYLRGLAKEYMEIASKEIQTTRRKAWRRKNSLLEKRPLIYIRACAWNEMEQSCNRIEDPFFQNYETFFRKMIFQDSFEDDFIIEPWVTLNASYKCAGWGINPERDYSDEPGGASKGRYPLENINNIEKMIVPYHEINEQKTTEDSDKLYDVIGDIIEINVSRGPAYKMWSGDISTDLGHLRGIENIMLDMMDNPEWLHRLASSMSQGILKTHEDAERKGDWGLSDNQNQAMPYAEELQSPAANKLGAARKELWYFAAAQEFTAVSPAMHEEFLLKYQLPIIKEFGLVAYGCCEDLTNKIDMLRQIPNLRRIAVSSFANVAKCAEQIGEDYVVSYRPSPADMVSYDFNPERIRSILKRDLNICKESYVDITLKDVETVQKDPDRIRKWVAITKEIIAEIWG
jgi:hypothetical protein